MTAKTEIETEEEARRATVETLQKFYSIIIAIALTNGLANLVTSLEKSDSTSSHLSLVAISIAFLSTIVPFYHGMERHLYVTHMVTPQLGAGGKRIPLLVDIFAFIIEGSILFAMGRNLDRPEAFLQLWTSLLIVDILWALTVWLVQRSKRPMWVWNNFIWCAVAWAFWLGLPSILTKIGVSALIHIPIIVCLIAVVEICRSVTDYRKNWSFYFPQAPRCEA